MRGQDVRALQGAVNKELRHRKLAWRCVRVDGQLGLHTLLACHFLGTALGFNRRQLRAMLPTGAHPHVSRHLQHLLRNPQDRPAWMRVRDRLRRRKLRKLRQAHNSGPKAAVREGRKLAALGIHETGTTNTGHWVDKFTGLFGLHAVPWCGCFAGWLAIKFGHCKASKLSFWNGCALIREAAEHKDGCYPVPFDRIEPGDILVYWDGEHIGTAAAKPKGDTVEAIEGNTSPTNGDNQADGGAIAVKTRSRSDVSAAIRIYG